MSYVLFKEPRTLLAATPTLYITRDTEEFRNTLKPTTSRKKALEFDTLAEAYQFGEENELDDWRVGAR